MDLRPTNNAKGGVAIFGHGSNVADLRAGPAGNLTQMGRSQVSQIREPSLVQQRAALIKGAVPVPPFTRQV